MDNTNWVNNINVGNIAPGKDQEPPQPTPQVESQVDSQVDSQPAQLQAEEPSSHSINHDTTGVDGHMPNAHQDNLNKPTFPSNVHDEQASGNLWAQNIRAAELQLAEDNLRRALAPQPSEEATDGNTQPNVVDHMPIPKRQATHDPRPTFRDLWPAQVLEWPALASSIGLCQMPPARLQTRVRDWEGERVVTYFLPDPRDLRTWRTEDVTTFVKRLHNEGVFVDWGKLGVYYNHGPAGSAGWYEAGWYENDTLPGGQDQAGSAGWYNNNTVLDSQHYQYPPGQEPQPALSSNPPMPHGILASWQTWAQSNLTHVRHETATEGLAADLNVLVDRFESEDARADFLATHDKEWMPPAPDPSIPQSRQDMKAIVTKLLLAMVSTEFAIDADGDNSFKKRWSQGEPWYSKEKMSLRCWQLVEIAKRLHEEGPSALQCFDHAYAQKEFSKTKAWSFEQRINAMANLLATSKRRCDMLLKGDQLDVFVGAPGKLLKTSGQNLPNNKKKGEALKRGREAIKDEKAKTAATQAARPSASTLQPAPDSAQLFPGRASGRTPQLLPSTAPARTFNTVPQPGFRNREHLGTAAYPSPAYTSDSMATTPGSHAMANHEFLGTQDLWGQTGAISRANSRGFTQQQDPYGIPHGTFPAQARTRQPGPHQPTSPGLSSTLSQKRPPVDALNESVQKRPSVQEDAPISSSYGPRLSYPSSGPVPNIQQSAQPLPQAQQLLQSQHGSRLSQTATSSTVQQAAPQSNPQPSTSLKRGPSGNLEPPTAKKRVREQ